MSAVISRIDQAGRISISAQQRRALGLEGGSPIVISVVGNELRIRSMSAAMAELQAEAGLFLQSETASVDAFMAQRRSDFDEDDKPTVRLSEPDSISGPEIEHGPERKAEPDPKLEADLRPEPERDSKPKPRSKR